MCKEVITFGNNWKMKTRKRQKNLFFLKDVDIDNISKKAYFGEKICKYFIVYLDDDYKK